MHIKKSVRSLKTVIILPLILLLVSLAFAIASLVYQYLDFQRSEDARHRSEIIAYAIQYTAEISGESPELNRMVQALGSEKDVNLIKVVLLDSNKIISSNRLYWRNKLFDEVEESVMHTSFFERSKSKTLYDRDLFGFQKDNIVFTYASSFLVDSSNYPGVLEPAIVFVDLDTQKILNDINNKMIFLVLVLGGAIILFVALVYMLLMRFLYRPVDNMIHTIQSRALGNKDITATVFRDDEIGILAKTLNDFILSEAKNIRALKARENDLQLIFDNVPVRIWYKDDKNTILRLNRYAAESMGMKVVDVEGKNTADLFPEMADKYLQDDLSVIRSGEAKLDIVEKYTPLNGPVGWVKTDKVPYFFSEQSASGVLVVAQDITVLKQVEQRLRENEQRFQLVIQATQDGIWDWPDMDEDEEYWSPQWKALLGYSVDEIEAKASTFFSMLHPDDKAIVEEALNNHIQKGIPFNVEYRLREKGGSYKWFRAKGIVSKYEDNNKLRMTGSITDIQKQKDDELMLQKYMRELERSNQDLDEFAYIASHDLKAPLRGIEQLASWIQEDISQGKYDETDENLRLMRGRVKRLEKLLSDLLEYSRVGRQDHVFSNVNVAELVTEIFELSSPPKTIHLELEENLPVFETLAAPFEQIFRNFISNAIKHHHNEGMIRISCREYDGDQYEFAIQDDGPGIDEKYHEVVFKMFKSLKPRDEVEGSGMGLALIKKIVRNYHGDVRIKSSQGQGSTFYFTWPKQIARNESEED